MPHRFGRAKLHQRYVIGALDAPRVELRSAADRVQVHGAGLLEPLQRLRPHTALPHNRAYAVTAKNLGLIRFLADARRRTGRGDFPSIAFLLDDGTAVIQDRSVQIDGWLVL